MAQYELNLRDYLRILRKHRYYFISAPIALAILTYLVTPNTAVSYRATSSVKFSQSSTMAGLMLQVFSYGPGDSVATQTHVLTSRPMMARLAQHLGWIPAELELSSIVEEPDYVARLSDLQSRVAASQVGTTNIIEIAAEAPTGDEARAIANGLADVFSAWSLEEKNRQVTGAKNFITQQLEKAETRLKDVEAKLLSFMEKNLDQLSLSTDELSRLQERKELARRLSGTLKIQVQQLEARQEAGAGQIDWISSQELNDSNLARFNSELLDLQLEKERLFVYQTATSPEVQAVENKIQTLLVSLIREYQATLTELEEEEKELNEKISLIPENDTELNRLRREKNVATESYTFLKAKYEEAAIREAEKIREVDIVEYATDAIAQGGSGKMSKSFVGALVGLVLGFVLALVAENMDTSIGTIEDVESYLEVPVLGVIPHIDRDAILGSLMADNPHLTRDELSTQSGLVAQFDPKSPVAEAYRSLRTNLEFSRLARPGRSFVVTSSTLEEGKSTTAANLAVALAQSGKRTLLVEADLRRPAIHTYFGLPRDPGLTEVLLGTVTWRDAVRSIADLFLGKLDMDSLVRTPGLDNLFLITCGTLPPNPAELLGSDPMKSLVKDVAEQFDVVIFDTPPVLPVTDAAILASQVDGVLLVYQLGRSGRGLLRRAKSHLDAVRADIRGVVLNDITAEVSALSPAEHYYQYYAVHTEEPSRNLLQRARDGVRGWRVNRSFPLSNGERREKVQSRRAGGSEYDDVLGITHEGTRRIKRES